MKLLTSALHAFNKLEDILTALFAIPCLVVGIWGLFSNPQGWEWAIVLGALLAGVWFSYETLLKLGVISGKSWK